MIDIETRALDVLRKWFAAGWAPVFARFNIEPDFNAPLDVLRDSLLQPVATLARIDRDDPLVSDLAPDAHAALCPNDPAKSIIYHVWAGAHPTRGLERPSLDALDVIENYIYLLGEREPAPDGPLVPMVLAYAYRNRAATAHRRHADMVYSRVAITRVGTRDARFVPAEQTWESWAGDGFRVTRARVGLFLCRIVDGVPAHVSVLDTVHGDARRSFVLPVRKLFEGARVPGSASPVRSIRFRGYFLGDKLKRVIDVSGASVPPTLDVTRAPFVNEARIEVPTGASGGDAGIELDVFDGACIVGPRPRAQLVSIAMQEEQIARFTVPPREWPPSLLRGHGIDAGNLSLNRHYTSLQVPSSKTRLVLETAFAQLEHVLPDVLDPLPKVRPRAAPEYANIRHRVEPDGRITVLGNTLPAGEYEAVLDAGGFEAAMFDDGVMDGAVWAVIDGVPSSAAFVLVTAPDFFPRADEEDLQVWSQTLPLRAASHRFKEGGPAPLSAGRFVPNLLLKDPWSGEPLFASTDNTVAALVSRPVKSADDASDAPKAAHFPRRAGGFLADSASNEFAPGWDVSYDELNGTYYYTTHGLGSPFPEDVKFCASANAYWPAASPDAARTFERPGIPSAIPMLDDELGFHPDSPHGAPDSKPGWDGEFGPFFQMRDGVAGVNSADIRRSDYVYNATQHTFASRVFDLSSEELIRRMEALRACIGVIPKAGSEMPSLTQYWIVRASVVRNAEADATHYTFELCVPDNDHVQPVMSDIVSSAAAAGYWRLWRPVSKRIKAECRFDGVDDLVPRAVRYASYDETIGAYGAWQEGERDERSNM
ncbi:hypothetical protein [Paraburkholderia rhizosphaerae]|uniref:Uncharacterized protein n=1 Tax=Paraburkholderia rhizosphaerae TaxID=480658 RepID=A0A4V3HFT6_9BURK|nr:hypothetical protein [Paraburkholderia rhizosphaerae]TDY54897.1 hypothetical protein BX592_101353 [Paraburkholderia rhizosphaerae]